MVLDGSDDGAGNLTIRDEVRRVFYIPSNHRNEDFVEASRTSEHPQDAMTASEARHSGKGNRNLLL